MEYILISKFLSYKFHPLYYVANSIFLFRRIVLVYALYGKNIIVYLFEALFPSKHVLHSGMTKFRLKLAPSRESEISALNCTTIPTHIF